MATGFKSATVTSGDVPSTQSNFPAYVDLSRLGITTQAEADSVRCYSDASKTTELAREIVSVSEMHVKIPSLTNTFTLYVDWDGSSSDYAFTDTYGRNAVWSDYQSVFHFEGNSTDSTGNGNGTDTSITYGTSYGAFGNSQGASFNGSSSKITIPTSSYTSTGYQITGWYYPDTTSSTRTIFSKDNGSTRVNTVLLQQPSSTTVDWYMWASDNSIVDNQNVSLTATTWQKFAFVFDGGNYVRTLKDGTQVDTFSTTKTPKTTTFGTWIGADQFGGGRWFFDGSVDEWRERKSPVSNDWVTTEYNNQSDESGFWGTWSDVGGGATDTTKFFAMM